MVHGGDIYTNGLLEGRELIDYSSNINPLGVPKSFTDNISFAVDALTRYPDIQYRSVLKALGKYISCPEEYFVLGNGAAEIIDLVISCLRSVLIVVPSFVEYEIDAKKWACNIEYSYLKENFNGTVLLKHKYAQLSYDYEDILNKLRNVEGVILANPNNPNGNIIDKVKFKKILDYCETNNKIIIIDEAFIEFTGDDLHSFEKSIKTYKCLFIIRALTKFFAMPGIRFGYGISSNDKLIKKIKDKQNPWNINCFAEVAAINVLKDVEYIEKSKQWIRDERPIFLKALNSISFIDRVFLTYGNFVLCKLKEVDADEFYKLCLDQGFVIRKADNFRGLDKQFIRLAIKDNVRNEKLIRCLKKLEL
ncbi:pyridoxal phosphate-dependent aminotransferase [Clostridium estertheticum]|uniref:pyridoxal phosphate-dependent aminotransferase n=1 Tax=Clostridium estertheticum TaxID=238834 RepID=UPI001CF4A2E7|nr:histidinol-phosphate transaminase [Clostridium estertheticum]MCB2353520.1 aminotransferase class I/II-fold pyridoxal phosphate-dependent enzyme [Clostridium estertheticum]WAG41859.1 aminotransferase class I/II-fold pyridoxal phosphate-dependent enzyme [Clostridium estertheticum]